MIAGVHVPDSHWRAYVMHSRLQLADPGSDWNQIAGKVKEKYGEITEDEVTRVKESSEQLFGRIQEKTGQAREHIEALVHNLFENPGIQFNNAYEATSYCFGKA